MMPGSSFVPTMPYSGLPYSDSEADLGFSPSSSERDLYHRGIPDKQPTSPLQYQTPLDSAGSSSGRKSIRADYFGQYLTTGPHKKSIPGSKWVSTPVNGTEEKWIEKEQEAVEWLSLFYDLVVVAVLIIFSTQHELSTPAAIPSFLSFFIIIYWVWVSQTNYDMRYEGNDVLNRFFKFMQIGLFIYQGAASKKWDLEKLEKPTGSDPYGLRQSQYEGALQSFITGAIAFAISRGVLTIQHVICLIQGKKAGRQVAHIVMTIAALLASMACAIVAVTLPSTSHNWKIIKIAVFYSGIGIEVANVFVSVALKFNPPVETHKVAERYGAFTLIILGEGIISVTKSFSRAIAGLSDSDTTTYVQVFLTILIIFLLYCILFGSFDKNDATGHGRATIWQMVHFPLCFGILLLVAAMVNVIVTLSAAHGITLALETLGPYGISLFGLGSTYLDPAKLRKSSKYMNKLSLESPFEQTITHLYSYLNETSPEIDPQIAYIQYAAQILHSAVELYGLDIPVEATNTYYTLHGLNNTWTEDIPARLGLRAEAAAEFGYIIEDIVNEAFTGLLWLLPVAGCVLILAAFRSMLWYRFSGAAHWVYHGAQLVAGVCLGLLGLLNIGPKKLDIAHLNAEGAATLNPLYQVVYHEIPLVIIASVYAAVYIGCGGVLWFMQRRQKVEAPPASGRMQEMEGTGKAMSYGVAL